MSSSNKTNYLGLNQFVGSDKPKMEDFNADNRLLDEKIQQHIQSQLHLTEQQRERLENPGYLIGSYTGDGTTKRTISVAQPIGFGFVFMVGEGLHYAVTTGRKPHLFGGDGPAGMQQRGQHHKRRIYRTAKRQQYAGWQKEYAQSEWEEVYLSDSSCAVSRQKAK